MAPLEAVIEKKVVAVMNLERMDMLNSATPGNRWAMINLTLFCLITSGLSQCNCHATSSQAKENEAPGGKIVYSRSTGNQSDIYVTAFDTQNPVRLTDHEAMDMLPSWSTDGKKIVFRTFRDGNPEIYIMNKDGRHKKRLTKNQVDDCNPKWSPLGDQIVFERVNGNNVSLLLMDTSGNNVRQLTDTSIRSLNASWSPTGHTIVFVSGNTNYDLFKVDIRTNAVVQLTFTPGIQEKFPSWSPDGRTIAYKCYGNDKPGIYLMDSTGGDKRFLATTNSTSAPAWSPDSKWLLDGGLYLISIENLTRTQYLEGDEPDWIR